MKLAVVVVSHNTCNLLRGCLQSLALAPEYAGPTADVEVVVVDNASHDGSAEMVSAQFPHVRLIKSGTNLGFANGNNLALHYLGFLDVSCLPQLTDTVSMPKTRSTSHPPDFVLLLNPDTEIVGDALEAMVEFLKNAPQAGACGASLTYGDGRFQHAAFSFPTLFQVALDLLPLTGLPAAHRLHDSRLNGRYDMRLWEGDTPFPVDFVLGAAMMVRGSVISKTGGFDAAYFMYCEEMDLCLRIQEEGWQIYAIPAAHVIHFAGQSSQQIRWKAYEQLWNSRFRFFTKHVQHYPPTYKLALRAVVRLGLQVRRRSAHNRFAHGKITGIDLAQELDAYAAISHL